MHLSEFNFISVTCGQSFSSLTRAVTQDNRKKLCLNFHITILKVFGEMPLTGIDETVKQAILQRNAFEDIDMVNQSVTTLRSRRGSHVPGTNFYGNGTIPATAGTGSPAGGNEGSRRQSRVQFSDLPAKDAQTLDLPGTSNGITGGGSPV